MKRWHFVFVMMVCCGVTRAANVGAQPAEVIHLRRHIIETGQGMTIRDAAKFYAKDFENLDTNGDGHIDGPEFAAMADLASMREQLPEGEEHLALYRMFAQGLRDQLDLDRDGVISLQEYVDISVPFARRLDADGDDFISVEEVKKDWEQSLRIKKQWEAFTTQTDGGVNVPEKRRNLLDERLDNLDRIGNTLRGRP